MLNNIVYRSLTIAFRTTALVIGTLRCLCSRGSDLESSVDYAIVFCICWLGFDILLQSAFRPTYVSSFSFLSDILSTLALVLYISDLIALWQDSPTLEVCIAGLVELRVISLINSLQSTRFFRAFSKRLIGSSSDPAPHVVAGDTRTARRSSTLADVINDDEELDQQLKLEKQDPSLAKLLSPTELKLGNTSGPSEDSRVRRKLTDINTTRIGVLMILCSVVARIVASKDDSLDSSYYFLSKLTENIPLNSTDSDQFWTVLVEAISGLSTSISSLAWIASEEKIPPISSHLLNELLSEYPIDDAEKDSLQIGFSQTCQYITSSSRWWFRISSICPAADYRRRSEIREISSPGSPLVLIIDRRESVRWSAILAILRTIFIFVLVLITSLVFQYDSWRIILLPLSRMVAVMKHIQCNPLSANTLIEDEQRRAMDAKRAADEWANLPVWKRIISRKPHPLQVGLLDLESDHGRLEATLLKLGSLLTVSLGEAGAESITLSLSGNSFGSFSRRRIRAVFCFIDIDNFNTLTEILQDRTILLVNSVAEIVHGLVDEFNGFVCRNNVGTSGGFFLIWRCDGYSEADVVLMEQQERRNAELAILCVCKIFAAVEKSPLLRSYREHPYLKQLIPNYSVHLTAGLHVGVSTEGAIGSEFKLEATYVGNDVLLTQHLAEISRTKYCTKLALSDALFHIISPRFRTRLCRKIDSTEMNGEQHSVYTIDLDLAEVGSQGRRSITDLNRRMTRDTTQALADQFTLKQARYARKRAVKDIHRFTPITEFGGFELARMRKKYETKHGQLFNQLFKKGILNFESGEFEVAKKTLMHCGGYFARYISAPMSTTRGGSLTYPNADDETTVRDGPADALLERIRLLEHDKMADSYAQSTRGDMKSKSEGAKKIIEPAGDRI